MHITPDLRLALPIRIGETQKPDPSDSKKTITEPVTLIWAYHTPISMDFFETNYRVIAATKQAIFGKSLGYAYESGPRVARLTLLDCAKTDAMEWGLEQSTGSAILNELKRLTNILAPNEKNSGFDPLPIDIAIGRNIIDAEEWAEAESAIVFFTCAYAMARKQGREMVATACASVLRAQITSLDSSAFLASLAQLTPAEPSQATVVVPQ